MLTLRVETPHSIDEAPLVPTDVPRPVLRFGEVLIRVEVCAACHTDLHAVEGDLPARLTPITPGHQVIGQIVAIRGVANLVVGQRVGAFWLRSACGVCRYCQRGLENLCESAEFNGYSAHGGYAEYMSAPGSFVVPIPASFSS